MTTGELRAYMAFERSTGPEEGCILVFARTAREARKLGAPEVISWTSCDWIEVAVLRLEGEGLHLRQSTEPHVIDNPPHCRRCEHWHLTTYDAEGLCEMCAEIVAFDREAASRVASSSPNPDPERAG